MADTRETPAWPALGVAVKAIVRDGSGRILLIRRAESSPVDPGCWDLPGGKLDYGETLSEALAREAREETGLAITVGRPVHTCHFAKEPFWVTCVTFACGLEGGEVRLSREHCDFAWIDPSELAGRTYARAILEQLEAYAAPRPADAAPRGRSRPGRRGSGEPSAGRAP